MAEIDRYYLPHNERKKKTHTQTKSKEINYKFPFRFDVVPVFVWKKKWDELMLNGTGGRKKYNSGPHAVYN